MLTEAPGSEKGQRPADPPLSGDDVVRAWRLIAPHVRRTPTVSHRLLSRRFGTPVYVKLENNQLLGSYKLRGWISLFAGMSAEERRRGVVTTANGEHIRPLAAAADQFGVAYTRVVARASSAGERAARPTELVVDGANAAERARAGRAQAERTGARFVEPGDEPAWLAGVGSIGFELIEQVDTPLDALFVPLVTGALAAGIAVAVKSVRPQTRLYGVRAEPLAGAHAPRGPLNLAAGLSGQLTTTTARVVAQLVDEQITVTEAELHDAIRCYAETLRQAADGPGAAALAGARHVRHRLAGQQVGIVLSGANIDVWTLRRVLHGEPADDSTSDLRELVGHTYR